MIRRKFIKICGSSAIVASLSVMGILLRSPKAAEIEGEAVKFRWRVPIVHKQSVENSLEYEGVIEEEKDKKGAFVFVFVGVVLLPYLAKSVLELMREIEHGGVIVDTCPPEVLVETDKRMPNDMVVVRKCKDKDVTVYRSNIEGPSELAGIIEKAIAAK